MADGDPVFKGIPIGPPVPFIETPQTLEQRDAGQVAYDGAIAAGEPEKRAQDARRTAEAACWRRQRGMPDLEPSIYDNPSQVPAWRGQRAAPPQHLPPRPACPCRYCQTEGAHATSCSVHDLERDDGACDCGLIETGIAPGPMRADVQKRLGVAEKAAKRTLVGG